MAQYKKNKLNSGWRFFFLTLLSFVFIVSCCLVLSKDASNNLKRLVLGASRSSRVSETFPSIPTLKENYQPFPIVSAQAALAIDLDSRISLYEKNPDQKLLPASTTKIVTALVAMEAFDPNAVLQVNSTAVDGQKMGLMHGEKIAAGNLLKGLLISSANDAAFALADNYPGGEGKFVEAMNSKATNLHLVNSQFENPVGFDSSGQVSTAKDLMLVAEVAMQNPYFAAIVKEKKDVVESIDGKIVHKLTTTNKLLDEVEGVSGVKTGWTENARENLVTYLTRDNKRIMMVVLGSQDRFGETKELINWILSNYEWKEVKYPTE